MRICLFYPRGKPFDPSSKDVGHLAASLPPLGLASIAAVLRKAGFDVSIIDAALPKPELLVYLYLEIDKLTLNIRKRGRDYEQNIDKSYLERIQSGYFDYIRQQQDMRILIIDTNNMDFVSKREDYFLLTEIISQAYETGIHRIKPK